MSGCGACSDGSWEASTGCGTEESGDWQDPCASGCGEATITAGDAALTPLGDNNFSFSIDVGTGPDRTLVVLAITENGSDVRLELPSGVQIESDADAVVYNAFSEQVIALNAYIISEAQITGYSGAQTFEIRNYAGVSDGYIAGFILMHNRPNTVSAVSYDNQATPSEKDVVISDCDTVVMFGTAVASDTGQTASYVPGTEGFSGLIASDRAPYVGYYLDLADAGTQTVTFDRTGNSSYGAQIIIVMSED